MKKKTQKKLVISKLTIANLSVPSFEANGISGVVCPSRECVSVFLTCASQGAPVCSEDSCHF
ncbi:hypothetical protein KTO58_20220 [Chitinophaga pendula]|uniref:hypothetical protein n=1 Tax=Chitinophaga TaxID=79328 RepID=UPI0012FD2436|nr:MULTISPECIES: hypothetical protein [Chitinophaga]UCJ05992.1 hypothetical protein KTO58_20220 [Chitinophaga pendula]